MRRILLNGSVFATLGLTLLMAGGALASPGTTERVSIASDGAQGNNHSGDPAISADGRFVAFESSATNLVIGDTNGHSDVFVRDRMLGTTERVSLPDPSMGPENAEANDSSGDPSISADGRFVAFWSVASNLVPGQTSYYYGDVFVRDRLAGMTTLVSVGSDGVEADYPAGEPSISADGRFVAFSSSGFSLAPGYASCTMYGFCIYIFVHDRQTGNTERVSVSTAAGSLCPGSPGPPATPNLLCPNGISAQPIISGDGRFVAFYSEATNLVAGDSNACLPFGPCPDIFLYDRQTQTTELINVSTAGAQANAVSGSFSISADGHYILFDSAASNLVPGDPPYTDVFVRDRLLSTTERLSSPDPSGNSASSQPGVSADGRFIGFVSSAYNANGITGIFLHDRITQMTTRVDPGADLWGDTPAISTDGRFVAFRSSATNLVPGDTNTCSPSFPDPGTCPDVFVRDSDDNDGLPWSDELTLGTDPADPDTDDDGCGDGRELGPDQRVGGLRNPNNPYDFYDTNGDRVIDLFNDILGVVNHWSPGGGPPYDVNYDRGPSAGPNPWNMTLPDGVIDLFNDILGVINQWGHDCR